MIEEKRPMTIDEALYLLREHMDKIPPWAVYWALRGWKCKPITDTMKDAVRACIAIDDLKLPITAQLVNELTGRNEMKKQSQYYTTTLLHNLGDKGIILLSTEQGRYGSFMWIMNQNFRDTVHWK